MRESGSWTFTTISAVLLATTMGVALAGCGGDDDDSLTSETSVDTDETTDPTATPDTEANDETESEAPAEQTGTVTIDGVAYELAGDDFDLCETVNPAFADDINIQASIDVQGEGIVIHGTAIESRLALGVLGDLSGDIFVDAGDGFLDHPAQQVDVSREDRTVSGTATVIDERVGASVTADNPLHDTVIEFSFTC